MVILARLILHNHLLADSKLLQMSESSLVISNAIPHARADNIGLAEGLKKKLLDAKFNHTPEFRMHIQTGKHSTDWCHSANWGDVRWVSGRPSNGSAWCRETPISRTAVRLIVAVCPSLASKLQYSPSPSDRLTSIGIMSVSLKILGFILHDVREVSGVSQLGPLMSRGARFLVYIWS